ncbi:MAG: 3'-5' exonuclease [Patescibacteria group bacterium]
MFLTVNLLKDNEAVLSKYQNYYQYVLVDEYQDTNKAQYFLTKLLSGKSQNLTVVGDFSQAIYSWRGADYRNLSNLSSNFPKIKTINLEQNYRSTQTILDAAYAVISKNEKHPILKLFTQNNQGEKIVVFRAQTGDSEAEFVAEKIKQLVDSGIDPTKIAVLYRTNAQSRSLEEAFIRHGIAYILIGGVRFYNRAEVKDTICLLRVFQNQADQVSWQRIEKNLGKRRRAKVEGFIKDSKNKKLSSQDLLERILTASGYLDKFDPDDEDDYRRLENIKELSSVARQFPDLIDFLENIALVQQEYSSQEKEKFKFTNQSIKLMTLHASKGLEFEAVFLVGMEEGLLPHSRSLEDKESLEEERRLCYVGITRAQNRLFLTSACRRLFFGQTNFNAISRFLEDLPKELLVEESEEDQFAWIEQDEDSWEW